MRPDATLIALAGLPGTGKSALARELVRRLGAVWLRVDSIEQAIVASGIARSGVGDAGYRVAHAAAEDNLRLGRTVVGDSVNPWMLTRDAWRDVATRSGARVLEVETTCPDLEEHRRRVETRAADVPGLVPPTWADVVARDYRSWERGRLVLDTAMLGVEACTDRVLAALSKPSLPR